MNNIKKINHVTIYCMVLMAGFALATSMYSTILPSIINHYDMSLVGASYFNMVSDVGYVGAMLFSLIFADRMRKDIIIAVSTLLFGASMLLMGRVPLVAIMFFLRTIMGMMGSIIDNTCVAYISDLHSENRAQKISTLHMCYAIGSVVASPFAAFFVTKASWNISYSTIGAFMLVVFVGFCFSIKVPAKIATQENESNINAKKKIPYLDLIKNKKMQILCLTSVCQSGAIVFIIWLPTYLIQVDSARYTIEFCSMLILIYSALSVISRAMLGAVLKKISTVNYLKFGAIITAITISVVTVLDIKSLWVVGIVIFGIFGGASFTAQTVLICDQFPEFSSTSTSLCGISRAAGNILINAVVGFFLQLGYSVLAMMSIVFSIASIAIIFFITYDKHGKIKLKS